MTTLSVAGEGLKKPINKAKMMMMMMKMKMLMNCFCGMIDRRKGFSFISNHFQDHCQRSSPTQISDTSQARLEPAHNPSPGLVD